MHLYTLKPNFMPKDIIDEFVSAIWTERYSEAGDVQLVVPASSDMIRKLAHGTFLGLGGTKEVMLLDTHSIKDGLLTVTGQSLVKFLDERPAWFENPDTTSDQAIVALTDDTTAGQLISQAVYDMVINPPGFDDGPAMYLNLNWLEEKIPGLELGRVDTNGAVQRLTINLGTLYNSIQALAQEQGVGIKLYLDSAKASTGPVLKFATYRGKNRTSEQDVHSIVRLTSKMDSLTDVNEVSSSASYKNVLYVVYKGMSVYYAEPTLPIPEGFNRRAMVVTPDDIYLEEDRREAYRQQTAYDTFANNNYIHTVDGQAAPEGIYKFMEDYGLGDIIELEGLTGTLSKARITEYIRSQDKTGEREYPTLSVVDHLSTGTIPDTEPDPIEPPGEGDPDFDDDIPDPEPDEPEEPPYPEPPDPDPDPEPPFPDPDPPPDPDPDEPPYDGPNPDAEPYTAPASGSGIVVTDTFPVSDTADTGSATDHFTVTLRANIKVQFTSPFTDPDNPWYTAESSGLIFEINIAGVPPFTTYWHPGEEGYSIGHFTNHDPPLIDPRPPSFVAYFQVHQQWILGSLGFAPLFIPRYPDNRLISIVRYNSGPVVWTPTHGIETVTNQWQAIPEDGDIWLEFEYHPF